MEVLAPTRTRDVGLRGLPGHTEDGPGLVGCEGKPRTPEQAVAGTAAAAATEGEGGTAAAQACKERPWVGAQAWEGLLPCRRPRESRYSSSSSGTPGQSCQGLFLRTEGSRVGQEGKGPEPPLPPWQSGLSSLCWARLTTSWTPCPGSSSAVTQICSLHWGARGDCHITAPPCACPALLFRPPALCTTSQVPVTSPPRVYPCFSGCLPSCFLCPQLQAFLDLNLESRTL